MEIKTKWYQNMWWLIGVSLLIIGSLIDIQGRINIFIFFIFIISAVFFLIWCYNFLRVKELHKINALILAFFIGLVAFVSLFAVLSWVKCGDDVFTKSHKKIIRGTDLGTTTTYCDIFLGKEK